MSVFITHVSIVGHLYGRGMPYDTRCRSLTRYIYARSSPEEGSGICEMRDNLAEEYAEYSLFIQLYNGRDTMLLPSEEWDCHLIIYCVRNN